MRVVARDAVGWSRPWQLALVPVASTVAGSAAALLPLIASAPVLPPFGLLILLAWRLLRIELWGAWIALPLGLTDDLLSGAPIGSAMALWTATLLVLDMVDGRLPWRDHWTDWVIASIAVPVCVVGGWLAAGLTGGHGGFGGVAQQIAISILCYPAVVRTVASLDRWRLSL